MSIQGWTKLTKTQVIAKAKKLQDGQTLDVAICSSNIRPFTMWNHQFEFQINKDLIRVDRDDHDGYTLQNTINNYSYYNCNSEMGRYVHYYIKA
jgi:hypothetical protein